MAQNIPVDTETLMKHVMKLLDNYDSELARGIKVEKSPYNDTIQMMMGNGSVIEIPHELQREAIQKWNVINSYNYEQRKQELENKLNKLASEYQGIKKPDEKSGKSEKLDKSPIDYKLYALIAVIIAILFYVSRKYIGRY